MGQIEAKLEVPGSKLGQEVGEKVQELGRQDEIMTKVEMARRNQREDMGGAARAWGPGCCAAGTLTREGRQKGSSPSANYYIKKMKKL